MCNCHDAYFFVQKLHCMQIFFYCSVKGDLQEYSKYPNDHALCLVPCFKVHSVLDAKHLVLVWLNGRLVSINKTIRPNIAQIYSVWSNSTSYCCFSPVDSSVDPLPTVNISIVTMMPTLGPVHSEAIVQMLLSFAQFCKTSSVAHMTGRKI